MRRRAAAIAAAALIVAVVVSNTSRPQQQASHGVVDQPAAPAPPPPPPASQPSAIQPARVALRWQLAAEHGQHHPIPAGVFTEALATELVRRPPAPAPNQPLARIVRLRELKTRTGPRQLVATIRRGSRTEYVNVLLDCDRRCRVAGIQ